MGTRSDLKPGFELSDDTIFVTGLPEDTTEDQLAEYFGMIGIIKHDKKNDCKKIWIYKDKASGKGKGEATITYDDPPTATSAIQWFDGKEFRGSALKIELAQRKAAPQFGRGGGRGGFRGGGGGFRGGAGGGGFRDSHRGYGGGGGGGRDNFDRGERPGPVGGGGGGGGGGGDRFRDGHRGYGGGGVGGGAGIGGSVGGGRDNYDRGARPSGGSSGAVGGGYRSSQRDYAGNRVRDDHDRGGRPGGGGGGGGGGYRDNQRSYGGSGERGSYENKRSHVAAPRGPSSRSDSRGARDPR